ncbi:formate dehydrogenase accessory protein FdhE [Phaeovulum sp.]|uniref:formate dehydrogenase accessory protein FdhE n=1 Tax=Phaeovulum sp. TaxID=2934796 RepID=UPI0039E5E699
MTDKSNPKPDPSVIHTIPKPPFARLPDPATLFASRAARLHTLAKGHGLAPYLEFLAELAAAQDIIARTAPQPDLPDTAALTKAHRHAMPPLNRTSFVPDTQTFTLIDRIVESMANIAMPDEAQAALARVSNCDHQTRRALIANVLDDTIPLEEAAEHAFIAAALQIGFAMRAAQLTAEDLAPVADGVCPTCGGGPSASLIVEWPKYEGNRYCSCALCSTLWHYVRAKCTQCAATGKISFREVDGGNGSVKAEVCGDCNSYVKVLYQRLDAGLDPIADDVATLALDLLLKDQGLRRGAANPFLTGY